MNNRTQIERSSHEILTHIRRVVSKVPGLELSDVQEQVLLFPIYLKRNESAYTIHFDATGTSQQDLLSSTVKLTDNDAFVANSMGLYVAKASLEAGKPVLHHSKFYSYVDETIFAGSKGAEAKALESIFSGLLELKTDQITRFEDLTCRIFRDVPSTQSGAGTTSEMAGLSMYGFDSSMLIFGKQKNTVSFKFQGDLAEFTPADPAAAEYCNVAIIALKGHTIKNGNNVAKDLMKVWNNYMASLFA